MSIAWRPPLSLGVAPQAAAAALLERAVALQPDNAALQLKLAYLKLDRYAFAAAAAAFEAALRAEAGPREAHLALARCYNALGRPRDALTALQTHERPATERAVALLGLGRASEAEAELYAVLAVDPHRWPALRQLSKLLRRSGRTAELLQLCETLHARSVGHAMLLYAWGTALALEGEHDRARALLFDRDRIEDLPLPVPAGFADIAAFNDALAEEVLGNPYRLSEFPAHEQANRGSSRVQALFNGRRPELVVALVETLQRLVESWAPPRYGTSDPWIEARPTAAHLKAWGLIQRGHEFEEWHLHPSGWLSGVYYIRVPGSVTSSGEGPGCIEFGPPSALARARPDYLQPWRHRPREGRLLLAPSHYAHRTIPSGLDEHRISFAFDVIPDRTVHGSVAASEQLMSDAG